MGSSGKHKVHQPNTLRNHETTSLFFRVITIMILSAAFFVTLMVLANGASTKRVASEPIKKIATMGGSTFWLINKSGTAGNAANECAKQGGKLASLNTQSRNSLDRGEV